MHSGVSTFTRALAPFCVRSFVRKRMCARACLVCTSNASTFFESKRRNKQFHREIDIETNLAKRGEREKEKDKERERERERKRTLYNIKYI